jgi:transmembrane 9 superfamily member 2/4
MQIFVLFIMILLSTVQDYYSPFDKGILIGLTSMIFPFFGCFNGFFSARLYTFFNGSAWEDLATKASLLLPIVLGIMLFLVELCERLESEMLDLTDYPFTEPALLLLYWVVVQFPCCYCGVYLACAMEKV